MGSNLFWKSTAWRRAVVTEVEMRPRGDMFKEFSAGLSMQASMTDAQEQRQASRSRNL